MLPEANANTAAREESLRRVPFYALVFITAYVAYLVLEPFLEPLTWAAVLALVFQRGQAALTRRIGPGPAALVTTLLTGLLIAAPAILLVSALAQEVSQVTGYVQQISLPAPDRIAQMWNDIRARIPVALPEDPADLVREGVQRVLAFLAPRAGAVVANLVATIGSVFAMLFALFIMLRDSDAFARELRDVLPLPRDERERLLHDIRDLVIASVGAGIAVAAAQGAIGGVAFYLLGLGAPVVWGVVMGFSSLIPVVGAALVWVPAALWLLLSGEVGRGVILLLVGALGISMVDNVLRPLLLAGRTSVSGIVVFFGLLGGVAVFGFVGLVLGPIILVVTGRLLKLFAQPG